MLSTIPDTVHEEQMKLPRDKITLFFLEMQIPEHFDQQTHQMKWKFSFGMIYSPYEQR